MINCLYLANSKEIYWRELKEISHRGQRFLEGAQLSQGLSQNLFKNALRMHCSQGLARLPGDVENTVGSQLLWRPCYSSRLT